jgi:hypothetical protein
MSQFGKHLNIFFSVLRFYLTQMFHLSHLCVKPKSMANRKFSFFVSFHKFPIRKSLSLEVIYSSSWGRRVKRSIARLGESAMQKNNGAKN